MVLTEQIKKFYNNVIKLRDANSNDEKITINFSKYDSTTSGILKDGISDAIVNYYEVYKDSLTDDMKEELHKIEYHNNGASVTIDYSALSNPEIRDQLRETIQMILVNRARDLYLNMTLNPTI